jgi:uncharacterized membrane protein YhhN
MKKILSKVYFLIGFLHILALSVFEKAYWLVAVTKAMLMPTLMVLCYVFYKESQNKTLKIIFGALVFSYLGDLFLLENFRFENSFLLGLSAFLITHILYLRAFLTFKVSWEKIAIKFSLFLGLILVLWAISIYWLLYPHLNVLKIPVAIYIVAIFCMASAALTRKTVVNNTSFWQVFSGAVLFMISDMILALDKFYTALFQASLFIMMSYFVAQYLIVVGIFNEKRVVQD